MESSLQSFEIENYKSIKTSGKVKLPGITLVLGPNSSGKTNIIESLLLLKQTFENNELDLVLNGNNIKTGEFKNIVFEKDVNRSLVYRFFFDRGLEDQDPALICPVCHKEYTYEGYFTNHMEDVHGDFWEENQGDIAKYSNFFSRDKFVEFKYRFDKEEKRSRFYSIKFGNPTPEDGLYISSIEFIDKGKKVGMKVKDTNGELIIDISVSLELPTRAGDSEEDSSRNTLFDSNPNFLPRQMHAIIYSLIPQVDDRPPWFRSPEKVGQNEQFLNIHKHKNKVQDFMNHADETEGLEDSIEVKEISTGLLARLAGTIQKSAPRINDIQNFLDNIKHVGPLRNSPRRIYFGAGGSPGLQAEGHNQVEDKIFSAERSGNRGLIEKTNQWLSETGFDCQLDVSKVGVGDLYQLEVKQSGLSVNLADTGFGLSQTLPIIIECITMQMEDDSPQRGPYRFAPFRSSNNQKPLALIEQPEIHLNPRIEASLADFFIDVMESGTNLIIETHSEYLLNRLQRRVVDGKIENKDQLVIYFISKEGIESKVKEIKVSSSGSLSDWPEGFFQDDFEDAVEILKESMKDE
ncbi:DUF3696 domain-containing protein [Halorussus salilacus]|uniref:AAA family ATPase n=1 Tax=Halorussus salilacus TaxID=2953750 RepID=UPI0020A14922|nr:DUF3696 domain-containing protein [Halorussus salilacus]USZ68318.1 DUF3696 domain-containing protein [Halorussus salilacus]